MAKRPAFQFYPSDWLSDTALRMCSEGARGVWMDMICYMHEGVPYGHLKVNGKVILPPTLARMIGCAVDAIEGYLAELQSAGVVQVDECGAYYSKRMVRDEQVREARASGGFKGGNPELVAGKDKQKVNLPSNLDDATKDKQKPTPSSSSSSSSSNNTPDGVSAPNKKFIKPALADLITEFTGRVFDPITEAGKFLNHYESNGWKVGRNAMKSWPHAVTNWIANCKDKPVQPSQTMHARIADRSWAE